MPECTFAHPIPPLSFSTYSVNSYDFIVLKISPFRAPSEARKGERKPLKGLSTHLIDTQKNDSEKE